MVTRPSQSEQDTFQALLQRALLLDLEVSHQGKILKLGAVLGGLTLARSGTWSFEEASIAINRLAQGAVCLLGHNLIRHDLPVLKERASQLLILRLPVIDTLVSGTSFADSVNWPFSSTTRREIFAAKGSPSPSTSSVPT